MSYEIPRNLKYEEKIIFNLSLWQAGSIGIFGALAAIIFLKTPFPIEIKILLSLIAGGIGAGFAFFNLKEYVQNFSGYFLKPRQFGYLHKEMKKFVEVDKIENNAIFLHNGKAKAIIQVQPINFHILSQRQQEAIISAYKDFLNSLDFPIQIVMRTVNLSLDEYLKNLEMKAKKSKNPRILQQFTEFYTFVTEYIDKHAVKNRLFYIVIPATTKDPKQMLTELEIRVTLCQEKLKSCNLMTKRLSTNELVSMLSSYFEGFIENGNEYQTMMTLLEKQKEVAA